MNLAMAKPPDTPTHAPRRRRPLRLIVKLLVSAVLVAYVVWRLDGRFGAVRETLAGAALAWLAPAFLLQVLGAAVAALRWRVLLDAQDLRVPYRRLLNSYLAAAFFNTFMPGMYGGDVIRAYDSARATGRTTRSITVVVLGRIAGLIALVGIAVVAILVNWQAVQANVATLRPLLWFLVALNLGIVVLVGLTFPAVAGLVARAAGRGRLSDVVSNVLASLAACRARPRHTAAVGALSVVFQLIVVAYYALCVRALGFNVPLYRVMMAVPVVLVLVMVIPSINGLGVRTGGFQAFLFVSLPFESGLAAAASLEIVDLALRLAFGLVGAAVFVARRRAPDLG